MIQDIAPSILDNQYYPIQPQADNTIFYFQGNTVLAKEIDGALCYPTFAQMEQEFAKKKITVEYIYLLAVDSVKFFLAKPVICDDKNAVEKGQFAGEMADDAVHAEEEKWLDGYQFYGVNLFRNAKPQARAFAAITAYHLYGWYRDNTYCGRCGKPMKHSEKERMVHCESCKNMVYPKICPAVIVAVTDGDRILLTKYAGRAYRNYALIAGFTEIGETVEETVKREVMEEVGLRVKNLQYYKSQPWALSGSLLYGFYCELDGDDAIHLDENELSVGTWVHADDLDLEDDHVSLTREMICKFVSEHRSKA